MRIKNEFKFIRGILIILFILSILFCKTTFSYKELECKTYYVEGGDTLWSIAEELKLSNNYYKNKDIRDIIYDIEIKNDLENANLFINQSLLIPNI